MHFIQRPEGFSHIFHDQRIFGVRRLADGQSSIVQVQFPLSYILQLFLSSRGVDGARQDNTEHCRPFNPGIGMKEFEAQIVLKQLWSGFWLSPESVLYCQVLDGILETRLDPIEVLQKYRLVVQEECRVESGVGIERYGIFEEGTRSVFEEASVDFEVDGS